ncbi:hypothetical protein HK101_010678 [Irineochytrium annulatum]|nr:hypothetical protein HK101_010678 [Irineochytrium annulatum]
MAAVVTLPPDARLWANISLAPSIPLQLRVDFEIPTSLNPTDLGTGLFLRYSLWSVAAAGTPTSAGVTLCDWGTTHFAADVVPCALSAGTQCNHVDCDFATVSVKATPGKYVVRAEACVVTNNGGEALCANTVGFAGANTQAFAINAAGATEGGAGVNVPIVTLIVVAGALVIATVIAIGCFVHWKDKKAERASTNFDDSSSPIPVPPNQRHSKGSLALASTPIHALDRASFYNAYTRPISYQSEPHMPRPLSHQPSHRNSFLTADGQYYTPAAQANPHPESYHDY